MLQAVWTQVGLIATVLTLATVAVAAVTDADAGGEVLSTYLGVAAFITWGVWSFGALNVTTLDGGSQFTFAAPSVAILGVVLALVPGYIALTGPIDVISRARDADLRDI